MITNTEVKLPATNGISFNLTQDQAWELIARLSTYALDGAPINVVVETASKGYDSAAPVAGIHFGGVSRINAELQWAYTFDYELNTIHFDKDKAGR
jgi:hypothetical protein